MSELLKNIDGRARLAGTNKLEILMFSLGEDAASGRREVFGLNVFKVREVMRSPVITRAPEMPAAVEGMVSLRGELVPVIDLARYAGIEVAVRPEIMIVTEFNGQTQGLLVESVDKILRIDWSEVRLPPHFIAGTAAGLVSAITELADGTLVMMLDVEQLLAETAIASESGVHPDVGARVPPGRTVLFADDSAIARSHLARTLDALEVRHVGTSNGAQAWEALTRIAAEAKAQGRAVLDDVQLVLTDIEMPEMDGYMLAKRIKSDPRFRDVPVVMHSSLSGVSNRQRAQAVGIDEYVTKFEPAKLAEILTRRLA